MTSALRPSAETRDASPGVRGDLMCPASFGRALRDAVTSRAACCMVALRENGAPEACAWISTDSAADP